MREIAASSDKVESHFEILLQRTAAMHGRVSNGEQIQVDVGPNGEHPMMEHFACWWRTGMKHWLKKAQPGDLFPFCCELGPLTYAVAYRDEQGKEREISDRWQQALLYKRIVEEQWLKAQGSKK